MLVDTHAHLDFPQFDDDRDEVVSRAAACEVRSIITVGIDLPSSEAAIGIAAGYEGVYAAVGLHPNESQDAPSDFCEGLGTLSRDPKVVAIGETGLDFYREHASRPAQTAAFEAQLALALELQLPVIVHCREAAAEVLAILTPFAQRGSRGVIHCFSADAVFAGKFVDLGFYISFAGQLTFPNAKGLRDVARAVPIERTLVETDCPFLAPQKYRGKRNEPAYVAETARELAEIKELPFEEVARVTTSNARKLFNLPAVT